MGKELRGRVLGVIGLGNIGTRVAELGGAIGMRVVGWNRSEKHLRGVKMVGLDKLLEESEVISINIMDSKETVGFVTRQMIGKMKRGVIVVNLADRSLVDEEAMARALKDGKVESYGYWGEDLKSGPLSKIETAIGLKGFAYYTEESMKRVKEIWVRNIETMIEGKPDNLVIK